MSVTIPTPDELRAALDTRYAAEIVSLVAALRSIVGDLRASTALVAASAVSSRALADAVVARMRSAGWSANATQEHPRGGNGYVVSVSAPTADAKGPWYP